MTGTIRAKDVLLYYPNLIGYGRVVCGLASFVLMIFYQGLWELAILLYLLSFIGDLFDGIVARKYDQCSEFGGMLDMITDRCATLGLLFILYGEYGYDNRFKLIFMALAILDISSHWCQMYSTASLRIHHKSKEGNENRFFLVRWYYSSYPFFGYCCVSAEVTYIVLYGLAHCTNDIIVNAATMFLYFIVPGCMTKQIVNVFQLTSSCVAVAESDANKRNKS